ncbi:transcriptional regulator with XRE-family HTH domain [Paenibacillus sp. SORGH_AS306]|uniref:helix-turn-helix transcriptional regulator n=1 Tax=unclassified Paenibacillus TaxID=185978 RepID=UPI00277F29C4|nr:MULTISPECIES: helix-turn-helix transcriptional regulator [unclassified Paenibacillus]MDQ1233314.1 transcriptional regulator with XRE-family HTH domain [Paenibacillus sp. SORGH_AS_0306]MDR6110356.1 transcriptional regulator with XRE-family HTH domain [Paenibacillus sp. SORGH_AS_0338]
MKKIVFAENLKKYREAKGISKEELGERVGVSGVTIGYWESGRNEPRMGKVELIANILGVEIDDLMFENNKINSALHNAELSDDQKKALELIMSLPDEEVKMFNLLMERSLKKD